MLSAARTPERYRNALIGLAAGDAWGYQVEFVAYDAMPSYPVPAPRKLWRISDDTQMTLALHDGLVEAADELDNIDAVTAAITKHFLTWRIDPHNNRAPGTTCMTSLQHLAAGAQWWQTDGALEGAGCGAVMRLVPAAFCPDEVWLGITALQAVITHKHPRAVAAALILAEVIREAPAISGSFLEHAVGCAMSLITGKSPWLHDDYLAMALSPITCDLQGFLAAGVHDKLLDALLDAHAVKRELDALEPADFGDPCTEIGQGWESASAVAVGLLAADMACAPLSRPAPLTANQGLAWAATSNGDSDSLACIAGAVIGAAHDHPDFWAQAGLVPKFESRYRAALTRAADQSLRLLGQDSLSARR